MNMRILLCGVVGGLLATLGLSLWLYLALPAQYSDSWPFAASTAEQITGAVLCVLSVIAAGHVAARWSWANTMSERVKAGLGAGLLAALVAYPLIGAPAAGVIGNEPIWENGPRPAPNDGEQNDREAAAARIAAEATVRVGWYPYLVFWGMFLSGGVLGALGGALTTGQPADTWGNAPPAARAEAIDASIAVLIASCLTLLMSMATLAVLSDQCEGWATQYGFALSWPVAGLRDWPLTMSFLTAIGATWFCGSWATANWRHPVPGVRRTARIATGAVILAPLATLAALLIYLEPNLSRHLVFFICMAAWIVLAVYWVMRLRRAPEWSGAKPAPAASARDRLLFNAGLLGTILPGLVMATGVSPVMSLALGVVAFRDVLFARRMAGADALSVDGSMAFIYSTHFLTSLYVAALWLLGAVVHAAAVVGWNKLFGGRASSAPDKMVTEPSA